jgi:hypothetical protein
VVELSTVRPTASSVGETAWSDEMEMVIGIGIRISGIRPTAKLAGATVFVKWPCSGRLPDGLFRL